MKEILKALCSRIKLILIKSADNGYQYWNIHVSIGLSNYSDVFIVGIFAKSMLVSAYFYTRIDHCLLFIFFKGVGVVGRNRARLN